MVKRPIFGGAASPDDCEFMKGWLVNANLFLPTKVLPASRQHLLFCAVY
jgi:hypothetical protein